MYLFFVTCNNREEIEAIRRTKPERLLVSYWYFKNVDMDAWIKNLGYTPSIMLDSGAFSAWNSNKCIDIKKYMEFAEKYKSCFSNIIALDYMGDDVISFYYYKIMREKGFKQIIPVFHYGDDEKFLKHYIADTNFVALGSLAKIPNEEVVVNFINSLSHRYPDVNFHVLGKSSQDVLQRTNVYSVDSSKYIMEAINGSPKFIKGRGGSSKVERAVWWINYLKNFDGVNNERVFYQTEFSF